MFALECFRPQAGLQDVCVCVMVTEQSQVVLVSRCVCLACRLLSIFLSLPLLSPWEAGIGM